MGRSCTEATNALVSLRLCAVGWLAAIAGLCATGFLAVEVFFVEDVFVAVVFFAAVSVVFVVAGCVASLCAAAAYPGARVKAVTATNPALNQRNRSRQTLLSSKPVFKEITSTIRL
jgi:predicted lysophospholipase L1 biosynthesis ABC-type transport system permease subunit